MSRLVLFLILFMTAVIWGAKKVHGYIISFEPQMVRSSFKDHLSSSNIDRHAVGYSKVTCR